MVILNTISLVWMVLAALCFYKSHLDSAKQKRVGAYVSESEFGNRRSIGVVLSWFSHWHNQYTASLVNLGYTEKEAQKRASMLVGMQCLVILSLLVNGGWGQALLMPLTLNGGLCIWTYRQKRLYQREADVAVYKIYRYFKLQCSAGMSVTEALSQAHVNCKNRTLSKALKAYGTTYFRTMDCERAELALKAIYSGQAAMLLTATLRHGLMTGNFEGLVLRQEAAMMRRFYEWVEIKGQQLKVKGIMMASGICVLIFILLIVPMVLEMQLAVQTIFST